MSRSIAAGRVASEVVHTAAKPWFLAYARVGYATKGVVYLLVGALALTAGLGGAGRVTDAAGALRAVARTPVGRPVLVLVAVGLLGYAIMRIVAGLFDPARRPRNLGKAFIRMGEVLSGGAYLFLVWGVLKLASGTGGPMTGDKKARALSGEAMQIPGGEGLIIIAAIIFAAVGVWFVGKGSLMKDVCGDLYTGRLGRKGCGVAGFFIRLGSVSQGIIFTWMGYLLFQAATAGDPGQARGMDGVLRQLENYGNGLLALMAVGLVAVGVSALIEARWKRLV
jgi:hypothetical protein